MANLKFRYTHDNPYNKDMERILNKYNFQEVDDDDEGIEYEATFDDNNNVDVLLDYFGPFSGEDETVAFKFIPYSKYGWGFNDEVMVIPMDVDNRELDELYMPTEDFINMFR